MPKQFISEPIKPVIESYDTRSMSIGAPGLPKEFIWRGQKVSLLLILCAAGELPVPAAMAAMNNTHASTGLRSKPLIMEQ